MSHPKFYLSICGLFVVCSEAETIKHTLIPNFWEEGQKNCCHLRVAFYLSYRDSMDVVSQCYSRKKGTAACPSIIWPAGLLESKSGQKVSSTMLRSK